MAVTTYNELYSLLKENEVYIKYDKGGDLGIMGLKMTLKRDLIPESDTDLLLYTVSTNIGEWSLSGDSDGALHHTAKNKIEMSNTTYPDWIKAYSTNYQTWSNIKIADIVSVQLLGT